MKIDNRIFLPFIGPFVMLALVRLFVWVAGFEWGGMGSEVIAATAFAVGFVGGTALMAHFFDVGTTIGHLRIGRADEGEG